jgi:diguanylate cyclase (GGDEF)-like protein/PAS domain S-box-containing protein
MDSTKVLVVEDERIVALHLRRQLTQLGYEVVAIAHHSDQALADVADRRPDLILMDIHLNHGPDGIETAQEIARLFDIPVIFLSAHSEEETVRRARATKPFGYLLKPFSERELHATLQMALERRSVETGLRQVALAVDAIADGMIVLSRDLTILSVNCAICSMTGYDADALVGQSLLILGADDATFLSRVRIIKSTLRRAGQWHGEVAAVKNGGATFPLEVKISAVPDADGGVGGYVALCSDATAVRQAEVELKQLAQFDPLTGLPNRLLAMDRLEHAMQRCERGRQRVGVLFVDLDHFKSINDSLGHAIGDDLLRAVARKMRQVVRVDDTVARFGGDEFMVVVEGIVRLEDVADVARKIATEMSQRMVLDGIELAVSASVGISLFPDDGTTRDVLIRAADTAMYAAKNQGRGRYAFYTGEMTAQAIDFLTLKQELRQGIAQGQLRLFVQPQIRLADGHCTGVEAFVRWQHPDRGLLSADQIIPVADRSGLISELGRWVIQEACDLARRWSDSCALRIAINVSPQQMRGGQLIDVMRDSLARAQVSARRFEIEVAECVLQEDTDTLHKLTEMGVHLAIDDFGTGYSSFRSLKAVPIDRLKIDRSFVQDTPHDADSAAIARAIIAMAHRLGLSVIGEGVETLDQQEFLRAQGCEEVQGFLHGRPMPPGAVAMIADARWQ